MAVRKGESYEQTIFSFLGLPGSGKGTLAEICRKELEFVVLSTGNLCRKYVALGTEFGKLLEPHLKEGHLIPDHLMIEMVQDWLVRKLILRVPIILEGYPRTWPQAESLLKFQKDRSFTFTFRVIFFEISEEKIIRRLSNRVVCSNQDCQAVYSMISKSSKRKGICDFCGSSLIKRLDDTAEVIRERLKVYKNYKADLLNFYRRQNQSVEYLYVERKTPEEVFEAFKKIL